MHKTIVFYCISSSQRGSAVVAPHCNTHIYAKNHRISLYFQLPEKVCSRCSRHVKLPTLNTYMCTKESYFTVFAHTHTFKRTYTHTYTHQPTAHTHTNAHTHTHTTHTNVPWAAGLLPFPRHREEPTVSGLCQMLCLIRYSPMPAKQHSIAACKEKAN